MKISDKGLDIIKEFEGYARALPNGDCTAYQSRLSSGALDVPTIGWGCTDGVYMGMVWTRAQAEEGLRREVTRFENAVTNGVKFIPSQNQFDALVSFAYNVGEGGLARSSVLAYANQGEFKKAADAFALWNRAGGQVEPGLVKRRALEAALFLRTDGASEPHIRVDEPKPQTIDVPVQPSTRLLKSHTMWAGAGAAIAGAATAINSMMYGPTIEQVQGVQTVLQTITSIFPPAGTYLGIASSLLGAYVMFRKVYTS